MMRRPRIHDVVLQSVFWGERSFIINEP